MFSTHPLATTLGPGQLSRAYWLYANQLKPGMPLPTALSLVRLDDTTLWGVFVPGSQLAVRLLPPSFDGWWKAKGHALGHDLSSQDLQSFFAGHLRTLWDLKKSLVGPHSETLRLSHGDADRLPGVSIDLYPGVAVIQSGSAAGDYLLPLLHKALEEVTHLPVFEKSLGQVRSVEGLPQRQGWLTPLPSSAQAAQSQAPQTAFFAGMTLQFVLERSQKTGLFLDQRVNLAHYQQLLAGLKPKSSLDICSYVGPWSAAAAQMGTQVATLIDQDERALTMATHNVRANGKEVTEVHTLKGDMFEHLSQLHQQNARFCTVVADPPAFAKNKKDAPQAKRAYARLTKMASRLVRPGGLYVACSCTKHVNWEEFQQTVEENLIGPGWILLRRGDQSPDHTRLAGEKAAEYLKCLFYLRSPWVEDRLLPPTP